MEVVKPGANRTFAPSETSGVKEGTWTLLRTHFSTALAVLNPESHAAPLVAGVELESTQPTSSNPQKSKGCLGNFILVSHLSPAYLPLISHLSPTCLPVVSLSRTCLLLVCHCLPPSSGCCGPPGFTLVSHLSPAVSHYALGALGHMVLHLSPTVFHYALGALGCMVLLLSLTVSYLSPTV